MLNVGLTGGIASGKSTVASMLVELGAVHIDLDRLAHAVLREEREVRENLVDLFGPVILGQDGGIDRARLARVVFNDPSKLPLLNRAVHPAVIHRWRSVLRDIEADNPRAVVISDVPLLIEEGLQGMVDLVVLVYISPEEQLRRLMARNGLDRAEAQARLAAQMPIGEKVPLADCVLDNGGVVTETRKRVRTLWEKLVSREKEKFARHNPGL
ncbi:MAG TPA: dephospho-CoA kinase [Syntrophales bacterium]|nr:dephospho-CoA kinase [Syntrophales bacterium]HOM06446.1 dephospho-CoA kinase [Syntrophales bacterium]HON99103.1 dephospho-CoA kinase [Syntrophales bacterium]HPC00211.1 dephospho-CoA kinase [Syntrophales bacterium]HPQ05874.1 dephospho-CoA kinase [Syntrophales bacterium]